jgi:hypothetical protein
METFCQRDVFCGDVLYVRHRSNLDCINIFTQSQSHMIIRVFYIIKSKIKIMDNGAGAGAGARATGSS